MISITKGDITKFSVDAIVNAANSSLLGGGGVSKKRNESYTLEKWYLYQISKIKGSGWKNCCRGCSSSGYRKTGKSSFY